MLNWWTGGFVVLVVGGILVNLDYSRGPKYEGRSASEWLEGADSLRETAAAFKAMGADGARYLAAHLTDAQYLQAKSLDDFGKRHPRLFWTQRFVRWPEDDNHGTPQKRAAKLLVGLGSNAAPAFGIVWDIFQRDDDDPRTEHAITDVLQSLPNQLKGCVPQLAEDILNSNRYSRIDSINLLASLGPSARGAIPALTNVAAEAGAPGRLASLALWKIDRQTNVVAGVLTHNLLHGSPSDQWATLELLKYSPEVARLTVPAIEHMLDSPILDTQMEAVGLLMSVDPVYWKSIARRSWSEPQPVVERLIYKIVNRPDAEKLLAIRKLELLGPRGVAALPELVGVLREWKPPKEMIIGMFDNSIKDLVAVAALDALAEMGPAAEPATDMLLELLRQDPLRTHEYCRALGAIGPAAARAAPTLSEMLATNYWNGRANRQFEGASRRLYERMEIASALCLIDPRSTNAISILHNFYAQTTPARGIYVRSEWLGRAGLTLYRIGVLTNLPSSLVTVPNFYLLPFNNVAIELLGDMGPLAKSALPSLIKPRNSRGGPISLTPELALAIRKIDPEEADRLCLPGILLLPEYPRNEGATAGAEASQRP
jgi:hypothetical protein